MEVYVVSDTHSNFFKDLSRWETTLEGIIRNNDGVTINLGDTIGEYNLLITNNSKRYISVPGNHDVNAIRGNIKIERNGQIPFSYWEAFYDKKTWKRLEEWGYGSNIKNVKKHFCYFLYQIDRTLLVPSHIPLKYDRDLLEEIVSFSEGKLKYIYNIYGHSHSSKFSISRRKYKDLMFISVHIPPFFLYASGWEIEFREKKISIKEVYYRRGEIKVEKVKKPKRGEWVG